MQPSIRSIMAFLITVAAGLRIAQAKAVGDRLASARPMRIVGTYSARALSAASTRFLPEGFYRLRYRSQTPAVLSVTPQFGSAFRVAPPRAVATVLAIEEGQAYAVAPSNHCRGEREADCLQAAYINVARPQRVTVTVTRPWHGGREAFEVEIQKLIDEDRSPSNVVAELAVAQPREGYVYYNIAKAATEISARYAVFVGRPQRLGILVASAEFTPLIEVVDSNDRVVATNTDFNRFIDPCGYGTQIDQLDRLNPHTSSFAYVVLEPRPPREFTVWVRSRFGGDSGPFTVRMFDLDGQRLLPDTITSAIVSRASPVIARPISLPARFRQEPPSTLVVYSEIPVSVKLKKNDTLIAQGATLPPPPAEEMQQPSVFHLGQLFSNSLDFKALGPDVVDGAVVEVSSAEPVDSALILFDFQSGWGGCGGGAIDPPLIVFATPGDFRGVGYTLATGRRPFMEVLALMYDAVRSRLGWQVLLVPPADASSDPAVFASSYAPLELKRRSITAMLVDFQVAIRVSVSLADQTVTVWTGVRRRGVKELLWESDIPEAAHAEQLLGQTLRALVAERFSAQTGEK